MQTLLLLTLHLIFPLALLLSSRLSSKSQSSFSDSNKNIEQSSPREIVSKNDVENFNFQLTDSWRLDSLTNV